MLNKTQEQMKDELLTELKKGYSTLEEIKDNSGEFIDGYLPVYNNQIIKEWQDMPSDYDNRGYAEIGGGNGEEINIINLMQLDLCLYYTDLFNEVIEELEEELEEVDA